MNPKYKFSFFRSSSFSTQKTPLRSLQVSILSRLNTQAGKMGDSRTTFYKLWANLFKKIFS